MQPYVVVVSALAVRFQSGEPVVAVQVLADVVYVYAVLGDGEVDAVPRDDISILARPETWGCSPRPCRRVSA